MCRRSCCTNNSREGAGLAAVAVLAAGAIVAVKTGHVVARIIHFAVEVLTIIMLTAASALAGILLTWVTVRIVRWHIRQHHVPRQATPWLVPAEGHDATAHEPATPDGLACGGTTTALRAISGGRSEAQPGNPVPDPVRRAG